MSHHVAIVAYDGLCTFEFGCAIELFALDRPELDVRWYSHAVCAVEPGPLRALGGLTVHVPHGLAALQNADTIVIPGWRDADEAPPPALVAALQAAYRRGARICSSARAPSCWETPACSMAAGRPRTGATWSACARVSPRSGSIRPRCMSTTTAS